MKELFPELNPTTESKTKGKIWKQAPQCMSWADEPNGCQLKKAD